MLGIWTRGRRMVGADETTELWRPRHKCLFAHSFQVVSPIHVSAGRKRGDFRIYLQSPSGTRATLLDARPQDYSSSGFMDWPFMSVHTWGEDPKGTWTLEVHNDAFSKWASDAKFFKWSLELYGTEFDPNSEEYRDQTQQTFVVLNWQELQSTIRVTRCWNKK